MSSQLITDRPQERPVTAGREESPSVVREDNPAVARFVGFAGAVLVIFAGAVLILYRAGFSNAYVSPVGAYLLLLVGVASLLFHAAFDRDVQFRRVYLFFAALALAIGAFMCFLPMPNRIGDQFGLGVFWMGIALLFTLAFLRNETDRTLRGITQYVLGGAGILMAVIGLGGGVLVPGFLLPHGIVLALLGLVYLTAFAVSRGVSDDLGYWGGVAVGLIGLLALVAALVRSLAPQWFVSANVTVVPGFFLPHGILLIAVSLLYLLFFVGLCSDSPVVVMTRRELGAYFYSPVAYLVLVAFILAHGLSFWLFVSWLLLPNENGMVSPRAEPIVYNYLSWLQVIFLLFVVPILTMRLLSEEKRTGTLEVMLTAPVDEVRIVFSKFFAALILLLLTWLPFYLYLIALRQGNQVEEAKRGFEYLPLIPFTICLLVYGAFFVGLGLFFSSLTRDQITSGVLTFAAMLFLTLVTIIRDVLIYQLGVQSHGMGDVAATGWPLVLKHISFFDLWRESLKGKLVLHDLLFPLTGTVLFLFLTLKVLEARKWS